MDKNNKYIEYNTKVSQEDFNLLETQRENMRKKQIEMIESRANGGTLSGLQERLRLSKSSAESKVLKSEYKDIDAKINSSGLDDNFQTRGIDQNQNIGYANYEYYVAPDNTF